MNKINAAVKAHTDIEKIDIADPDSAGRSSVTVTRRTPAIDRLVRAGTLGARHRMAAERLYLAYVIAEGARPDEPLPLPMGAIPGWMRSGVSDRQAEAIKEYRGAILALGQTLAAAVVPVVLYDLTIDELVTARRRRRDRVIGHLEAGLDRLADHWGIGG